MVLGRRVRQHDNWCAQDYAKWTPRTVMAQQLGGRTGHKHPTTSEYNLRAGFSINLYLFARTREWVYLNFYAEMHKKRWPLGGNLVKVLWPVIIFICSSALCSTSAFYCDFTFYKFLYLCRYFGGLGRSQLRNRMVLWGLAARVSGGLFNSLCK